MHDALKGPTKNSVSVLEGLNSIVNAHPKSTTTTLHEQP
jgi:hypothetical protein